MYAFGLWGITHVASALLFLLVEKPMMNVEVLVFKRLGLMPPQTPANKE